VTDEPVVGFIGLGRMGVPMATNVARAGHRMWLYNRTRDKAEELAGAIGASVADDPCSLAAESDIVITMVADIDAVDDVYTRPDGILKGIQPHAIAVEMSTIGPEAVQRLAEAVREAGARLVDAPVSGSVTLAEEARLTIMAGGAVADVEQVRPVLQTMGGQLFHIGPVGFGASLKLAVNAIVYGLCQALSEGLVLAERAGIDRLKAYEVIASSAVAAPFVHYRRTEFEHPGEPPVAFRLTLAKRDLDLILALGERLRSPMPQTGVNRSILEAAVVNGFGERDVSAVADYLRQMRGD
jgi:3-hydroxyisobutyrate dehydrogenase/2-hydroxy-3-oxopropionate reductase